MGKRAKFELERREMLFYKGEWERLREILAPRKLSPTEFVRELVHKKLRQIEDRANSIQQSMGTIDVNTDGISTEPSFADES